VNEDVIERPPPTRRRGRLKLIVLTGLVLVLIVGALGAWWLLSLGGMFSPRLCENSEDDLVEAAASGDTGKATEIITGAGRVTPSGTNYSPLYCAAKNGHTDIVRELLAHGAAPDPSDPSDTAPLVVASRDGRGEAVEALLAAGANPNRPNLNGSALLAAVAGRSPSDNDLLLSDKHVSDFGEPPQEPLDAPSRVEAVRSLLKHGADPEGVIAKMPSEGSSEHHPHPTPLFTACYTNQPHVVEALLAGGAKPSNPSYVVASELNSVLLGNAPGTTPMMRGTLPPPTAGFLFDPASYELPPIFAAAGQGRREIMQALVTAGADPNQEALGGFRPLHAAVLPDDPDIVRNLVAAGADPSGHGPTAPTPYQFAVEQGRTRAAGAIAQTTVGGG
jgi:cytohesin